MKHLIDLTKRAFFKLITGPLKYGKKNDYNARQYWHDRFAKYGDSIKGPGNEALSEHQNIEMYTAAREIFLSVCKHENVNFQTAKVCEIGLGTGFYTQILFEQNVQNYRGFDIADNIIPRLTAKFPTFTFQQKDISSEPLGSSFDLIIIIDVVQHIVNRDKFMYAINNLVQNLSDTGTLLIGPLMKKTTKERFYVHSWTIADLKKAIHAADMRISDPVTFRNGHLYVIQKQA